MKNLWKKFCERVFRGYSSLLCNMLPFSGTFQNVFGQTAGFWSSVWGVWKSSHCSDKQQSWRNWKSTTLLRSARGVRSQGTSLWRDRESQLTETQSSEQNLCRKHCEGRKTWPVIGHLLEAQCEEILTQTSPGGASLGRVQHFGGFYLQEPYQVLTVKRRGKSSWDLGRGKEKERDKTMAELCPS